MITRRKTISLLGAAGLMPFTGIRIPENREETSEAFRFCLNTSTVSKQPLDIRKYIEIAAEAGYDGIEIWIRDLNRYFDSGGSVSELRKILTERKLVIENAIGFAPWLADRDAGFRQMQQEMEMVASVGGKRIAAPAAGVKGDKPLDLFRAGERYNELLELGRKTGVMPQLEFWGASDVLWHIGQALMIAAASGDKDARILPDVYHMFRGGSSFNTLNMIDGSLIEVFHFNDFTTLKPRHEQNDSDRVYPGDGKAPFSEIISSLRKMEGVKIVSLELFNEEYWKKDPLTIARTGLQKMKSVIAS